MSDITQIAKSLRLVGLTEVDDAAALLEEQDARIAELEARAGEAVAWLYDVKITKHVQTHRNDRYYSLDGGETFVQGQPLYTNPPTGDAAGKDEQRVAIQECIDYLTPAAKQFSELGMGESKHARCIRVLRTILASIGGAA